MCIKRLKVITIIFIIIFIIIIIIIIIKNVCSSISSCSNHEYNKGGCVWSNKASYFVMALVVAEEIK